MQVITIEDSAFQYLIKRLDTIENAVNHRAEDILQKSWLNGEQAMDLLSVSRRTLQNYRDRGILGFSQVGNKFYYRACDIRQHLDDHYQAGFGRKKAR